MTTVLFYVFSILAVVSALMVITRRNPVNSAISLLLTFVCIAALYILLNTPFLAVIQITVYAGAILVLILFVIMLLNLGEIGQGFFDITSTGQRVAAIVLSVVLLIELGFATVQGSPRVAAALGIYGDETIARVGHTQSIGRVLFTDYVWPFEVITVLLIVAIVGAVLITRHDPQEGQVVMPDGSEMPVEEICEEESCEEEEENPASEEGK